MGAVVSCFVGALHAIGNCLMTVVNAVAGILSSILSGVVAICRAIISVLTCGWVSRRRRSRLGHSSHVHAHGTGRHRWGSRRPMATV